MCCVMGYVEMIKKSTGIKELRILYIFKCSFFTSEGFDVNTNEAKWDLSYIVEYITPNTMFWWGEKKTY